MTNATKEAETEQQYINIELVSSSVHRLMNEKLHASILKVLMEAAHELGWGFEYTKKEYVLPNGIREQLAAVIWPAHSAFTKPLLHKVETEETIKSWAQDAIEDGWAGNWLDLTLDSLSQLGIKPVPYDKLAE